MRGNGRRVMKLVYSGAHSMWVFTNYLAVRTMLIRVDPIPFLQQMPASDFQILEPLGISVVMHLRP